MGDIMVGNPTAIVPPKKEATYSSVRLVFRTLVISTIVIFSVETFLMVLFEWIIPIRHDLFLLLDGLLLVVFLFPMNYYFIVLPLRRQVEEHQRTNQELVHSYEVLDQFFAISDVLIAFMDSNFNFIRVNQAYADTDQKPASYYVGKNHFELFPDRDNQLTFEAVVKTGKTYRVIEKPFEFAGHPERGITYWDWTLFPIPDPEGRVIALLLVLSNVTERKRAKMAQEEIQRRFRAVFNQTFQHSGMLDPSGIVRLTNQTALDFTGLDETEVNGRALWDVPWWDDPQEAAEYLEKAVEQAASGGVARCVLGLRMQADELATMDITIKPLLDEHGNPSLLIYEARDISERIQAEEALLQSDEEIKRLYEAEISASQLANTLHSASLALSRSLDSTTVLEALLDHLQAVVPYTSAHVNLLEDEDTLVVRLARGEEAWDEQDRLLGKRLELCTLPVFQPIFEDRQTVNLPDSFLYSSVEFLPFDQHMRSWLGIPLQAGEQVIGVCILEHYCPDFFTEDMIHWATALTSQAAVAIQNAWLFEQVRDGREHLQGLSRRLVEAQETERHYIARELHDEAGQALASLMVGLRLLERDSGDPASVVSRSHELKGIADGVLENLHRLAIDLRPASLDHLGLVAAIRQHAETISDQHEITVQFETVGKIDRLSGDVETAVYRIVQEALTNVIRHAHATRVGILLERRERSLVAIVEDNGVGFDPSIPAVNQLGMLGIRERADMLGGTITIESEPGTGTSIFLEIPCLFES